MYFQSHSLIGHLCIHDWKFQIHSTFLCCILPWCNGPFACNLIMTMTLLWPPHTLKWLLIMHRVCSAHLSATASACTSSLPSLAIPSPPPYLNTKAKVHPRGNTLVSWQALRYGSPMDISAAHNLLYRLLTSLSVCVLVPRSYPSLRLNFLNGRTSPLPPQDVHYLRWTRWTSFHGLLLLT